MTEFDLLRKPEYLHVLLNHLPRQIMNGYSIPLVAFGLLTGCVTVPPPPLTADHPESPSAPQGAVHPLGNALAADDLTKKTREILAQTGEQHPSPTPIPEQRQMDQMPGMKMP